MKLGKLPARPRPKDITFHQVATVPSALQPAPVGFGHYSLVPAWGMLGNDQYGDCVWAGADHETMMLNAENERTVTFTPEDALADYAVVTGFDPANPATDQGTDVHAALDYRRQTGLRDSVSDRHKIGAYVSLEPGDWTQMLEALRAFDFVAIGFEVPDYAMAQFSAGKPWSYQKGGTIEGGHYVPVVGRPHVSMIDVVTWGATQQMTRAFFHAYCDEAYGVVSAESLNAKDVTPEGLDMDALNAALGAL